MPRFITPFFDLPPDHPEIGKLLQTLGRSQIVLVQRAKLPNWPALQCYRNSAEWARANGGTVLLGWRLLHWPGLYLSANHHAVWQAPDGRMLDVTPKYPIKNGEPYTTFVPDPTIFPAIGFNPVVEDRDYILRNEPDVYRAVEAYKQTHAMNVKVARRCQLLLNDLPPDSDPSSVLGDPELTALRQKLDAAQVELGRLQRSLIARYGPRTPVPPETTSSSTQDELPTG